MSLSKPWEMMNDWGAWPAAVHGVSELDMMSDRTARDPKTLNVLEENCFIMNYLHNKYIAI